MPIDALCLTALAEELRPVLEGARIDKIYQPTRDETVFHLRSQAATSACCSPPGRAAPGPT